MNTKLHDDEKLIQTGMSCRSAQVRDHKGHIECLRAIDAQPGELFITNKRIIFKGKQPEYNHSFLHSEIRKATGKNKSWVIPGALHLSIFDWIPHGITIGRETCLYILDTGEDIANILNKNFYKGNEENEEKSNEENEEKRLENEEKRLEEYIKKKEQTKLQKTLDKAKRHEKLLEFDAAAEIYKELMMDDDVVRVRKLKAEQGAVKVTQKVVHGDEVTEIKDSVINRSNVGSGGKSKAEEIKEIKELYDAGAIDEDEFKQIKKDILGKR